MLTTRQLHITLVVVVLQLVVLIGWKIIQIRVVSYLEVVQVVPSMLRALLRAHWHCNKSALSSSSYVGNIYCFTVFCTLVVSHSVVYR